MTMPIVVRMSVLLLHSAKHGHPQHLVDWKSLLPTHGEQKVSLSTADVATKSLSIVLPCCYLLLVILMTPVLYISDKH